MITSCCRERVSCGWRVLLFRGAKQGKRGRRSSGTYKSCGASEALGAGRGSKTRTHLAGWYASTLPPGWRIGPFGRFSPIGKPRRRLPEPSCESGERRGDGRRSKRPHGSEWREGLSRGPRRSRRILSGPRCETPSTTSRERPGHGSKVRGSRCKMGQNRGDLGAKWVKTVGISVQPVRQARATTTEKRAFRSLYSLYRDSRGGRFRWRPRPPPRPPNTGVGVVQDLAQVSSTGKLGRPGARPVTAVAPLPAPRFVFAMSPLTGIAGLIAPKRCSSRTSRYGSVVKLTC